LSSTSKIRNIASPRDHSIARELACERQRSQAL
jgi:hypothetical protein